MPAPHQDEAIKGREYDHWRRTMASQGRLLHGRVGIGQAVASWRATEKGGVRGSKRYASAPKYLTGLPPLLITLSEPAWFAHDQAVALWCLEAAIFYFVHTTQHSKFVSPPAIHAISCSLCTCPFWFAPHSHPPTQRIRFLLDPC